MTTLDRYFIARVIRITAALTGVALLALMLERMLRVLDLVVNAENLAIQVAQIMGTLMPHYLGIALPTAFFLGVLLVLQHASRSNQISALQSAGASLTRIVAPFMLLAGLLAMISFFLFGVLQPQARYTYRALTNAVMTETLEAAIRQGAFVSMGDRTVFAEQSSRSGGNLEQVFVYEQRAAGDDVVLTAPRGVMTRTENGMASMIELRDGQTSSFGKNGELQGQVSFGALDWTLTASDEGMFRERGADEREMTISEVWRTLGDAETDEETMMLRAELDGRLARILIVFILPIFAAPLALNSGRTEQSAGLAIGLVLLITVFELIELGESLVKEGIMPPFLGIWAPLVMFGALSVAMFYRVAYTNKEPPLFMASEMIGRIRFLLSKPE
ncbi:MAG: LptF/LptG family permease [Euryhalocaulis sp.]|uniref:LptF/LptG family permease n=1 Tax=Euryhalocaulis sp. TaxID=2744307 RepID=UPI001841B6D9|nr:LptF/LptG family permease [Euryhalocaulis sp.]MBA4802213.1 LptF/LptG family permease [Euryhalocaulis sp.]